MMASTKLQGTRRSSTRLIGLIVAFVLLGACLFFALPAILSGNLLFATGNISGRPAQVVVYHEGKKWTFKPGDPEYDKLVDTAYDAIRHENGITTWGNFVSLSVRIWMPVPT